MDGKPENPPLRSFVRERSSVGKLVIVESPAKARTVGRFLGEGYRVRASVGHIRDLPERQMGVDIEHDFRPHYVITPKKKSVVKELRGFAEGASEIYPRDRPRPRRRSDFVAPRGRARRCHPRQDRPSCRIPRDHARRHRPRVCQSTRNQPAAGRRAASAPRARPYRRLYALVRFCGRKSTQRT